VRVVEQVCGGDGVVAVELHDGGRDVATAQVRLDADELPCIMRVDIVGRTVEHEALL
jgi:hypothetical protein